jgi:transglutaminase-like putative cysteine protease
MQRRKLLKAGLAMSNAALLPRFAQAQTVFAPKPEGWRTFQVVTRVELAAPGGKTQAWVPVPSVNAPDWCKPLGSSWTTNGTAVSWRDPKYQAELVHATWAADVSAPAIEVTSKFSTRDRAINLAQPPGAPALSQAERKLYTDATEMIPTDGIVRETSDKIVVGKSGELAKARAIYEWIVDNTFRDPKTRGCGSGDVGAMLRLGNLSGKCADLNALYVGLARAAGLPARDVYGLRVAPSKFGYKSLGAGSEVVTKAQHCRAEVFLTGFGWLPVDPADVRKVVLEEPPGQLALDDPKVVAARKALFGAWEMNWLAYNIAHDIKLPGSNEPPIGFLMYPQAEIAGRLIDSLDPDAFKYTITAKELAA